MHHVEVPSRHELDPFVDCQPRPLEVGDPLLSRERRCLDRPEICRE